MPSSPSPNADGRPRVVLVRGHQANPWELRPWQERALAERYAVSYLRSRRGWFDTSTLALEGRDVWTARDLLPRGALGDLAVRLPGERYLGLRGALRGADIVHAQELGYWYSMQAAKLRASMGFKLVLTVWETIPMLDSYRNIRTRAYRAQTLREADMFLAMTERAKQALLLEGAREERIRVCPPGIDTGRFGADERVERADPPVILSPARLVWEKGHQDVLRALALLRRGTAAQPARDVRLQIVGSGPELGRLQAYAGELGVADAVELRGFIPYEEMPRAYARASCVVLASLPTWSWEEQFGMVLAEAMAAGAPILASSSGAIPEVAGAAARYFSPGDWVGLATVMREALASPPAADAQRAAREAAERYSTSAAAERVAAAYEEALGG